MGRKTRLVGTRRLVAKSLSYRAVSILVTAGIAGAVSGNLWAAVAVGGLDGLVKVFLFAGHELLWEGVK